MRILIFHGYLLGGTGSNVYNANLVAALLALGHQVDLLCQERHPENFDFISAHADWDSGKLVVHGDADAACTLYRPNIAGLLPVYVADRYEGIEARPFPDLSDEELDRYIDCNVRAMREVTALHKPDLVLANHLVMGPAIAARAVAGSDIPLVVKVHGSDLEYTVRPHPERFLPFAHEGVEAARAVLVGSSHIAEILWETVQDPDLPVKTWLGPPGVDIERFRPTGAQAIEQTIKQLKEAPQTEQTSSTFSRDPAAIADALERIDLTRPLVVFVGKFLVSKGVDLLLAAWPLVLEKVPSAQLALIGFGAFEPGLKEMVVALSEGDREKLELLASQGRALEGGKQEPLQYLSAFLASLEGERLETYLQCAEKLPDSLTFVGRLEHPELATVLPLAEAMVVPSTFPEAFGMVSIEAAACGALPVAAAHSGLAEVAAQLAQALPQNLRWLLSFPCDASAVEAIAERLSSWLTLPESEQKEAEDDLVTLVRERFSWQGVARTLLAASQGEEKLLTRPVTRID